MLLPLPLMEYSNNIRIYLFTTKKYDNYPQIMCKYHEISADTKQKLIAKKFWSISTINNYFVILSGLCGLMFHDCYYSFSDVIPYAIVHKFIQSEYLHNKMIGGKNIEIIISYQNFKRDINFYDFCYSIEGIANEWNIFYKKNMCDYILYCI